MSQPIRTLILIAFVSVLTLVLGQNCGIQQPGVDSVDLMSVKMTHTGFESSCLPCHEARRPGNNDPVPVTVSVGTNQSAARFTHNDQFGGMGDCVSCHAADPRQVGITWKAALFGHVDSAGVKVTTCTACHAVPMATPTSNPAIGFDHVAITQDCASCHTKPGVTWADATGAHSHVAGIDSGKCYQCHISQMPIANSLKANLPGANKNWFTHSAQFIGVMGTAGQDCSRCHLANLANLGVAWGGAKFDHKISSGLGVNTCTPCHTTGVDRPAGVVGTPPRFDHAVAGTGDCIACHLSNTAGTATPWRDGKYAHNPKPTTCTPCHEINRPLATSLQPPSPPPVTINKSLAQFLHKDAYVGLSNCVSCHSSKPNLIGVTWINSGYFDHFDKSGVKVATCVECHKKPTATPTTNPAISYDHAGIGVQDCSSCHQSPGVTWKDATNHAHNINTDSGRCYQCHTSDMPAAANLKTNFINKNYFSHAVQFTGTMGINGDCTDCHLAVPANLGVRWSGGKFDHKDQNGVTVATCVSCHTTGTDRPVGASGINLAGPLGNYLYNHANGGTGDCVTCHKTTTAGTATPWRDGNYGHSPTPTSCTTCHKQVPAPGTRYPAAATTVNNVYFHAAAYNGTSDCATCHRNVPANAGVRWAGGLYNHTSSGTTAVGTCYSCHQNSLPSTTTAYPPALRDSFVHSASYIGTDCKGCHSTKNTDTKLTSAWAGGKWSSGPFGTHKTTSGATVTTCLPCHSNRDHNKGKECFQCHKNAGKNWDE